MKSFSSLRQCCSYYYLHKKYDKRLNEGKLCSWVCDQPFDEFFLNVPIYREFAFIQY